MDEGDLFEFESQDKLVLKCAQQVFPRFEAWVVVCALISGFKWMKVGTAASVIEVSDEIFWTKAYHARACISSDARFLLLKKVGIRIHPYFRNCVSVGAKGAWAVSPHCDIVDGLGQLNLEKSAIVEWRNHYIVTCWPCRLVVTHQQLWFSEAQRRIFGIAEVMHVNSHERALVFQDHRDLGRIIAIRFF